MQSLSDYQWHIFTELEQKFYNLVGNTILNNQGNLEGEKKKAGGVRPPDYRLYYKATVIKTVWYSKQDRNP